MREIEFRCWDKVNKKMWHNVQNAYDTLHHHCLHSEDENCECFFDNCSFGAVLVDNDLIVMQYTGLKDKNRVKIFEGDLIELDGYGRGKVVFDEAMFQYKPLGFSWQIEPGVNCDAFYPTIDAQLEIIGNIYENPELLK